MNPTWLYAGAVYAVGVAIARRAGTDLPKRIAALFYLLVLLFLFRPMTQEYVNLPVDFLQSLPPWTLVNRSDHVANDELNDLVLQIAPWAHQVRESWKALKVPLWNPLSGSGYPLLGNAQSSALSPLRLLALPLPLGYAFTAEAAWKLLIAMSFTWLYCRRRGYSDLASALGAISFGFCTFLIVWLHFPLVTVAAFVPAVIYALDLLLERITYKRFVFAVAAWALMLFGGHPETASHTFFLALLYLLWVLGVERPFSVRQSMRVILVLGAVMFAAAFLSAPFLAPLADGITKSKRYHELKVNPAAIGYYSDFPSQVVLFQPHFFGEVPHERPWGPSKAESITGFAGILGFAAWFALLAEILRTRRWRSREAFFVVATPVVLGIILAWPVVSTLFHLVLSLAANARLRLLLCFLLAIQAAAMIDLVERGRMRGFLAGLAIVSAMLLYLMYTVDFPAQRHRDAAMLAIIPSLAVVGGGVLVAVAGRFRPIALFVLLTLVIAELWKAGRDWNPVVPAKLMYPKTPLIAKLETLKRQEPPNAPFRIVGIGPYLFPNSPAIYGFEDIRAHDPMSIARYLGMLRVMAGYDTDDYFARWDNIETRLLDYLNVKYLVTPPAAELDPARFKLVYNGRDGRIFQNLDVLPRFFTTPIVILEFKREVFVRQLTRHDGWAHTAILRRLEVDNEQMPKDLLSPRPAGAPEATMEILQASGNDYTIRVRAPRHTLVVSSIPFWRGWRVEIDGRTRDAIEVNGVFLGCVVPPGVTTARIYFDPLTFKAGTAASILTLLALCAPFARSRLRLTRSR